MVIAGGERTCPYLAMPWEDATAPIPPWGAEEGKDDGVGDLESCKVGMAPTDLLPLCTCRKLWNMKLKDPNSR